MESVSGLLLGLCFAAVLGGTVHLLSPNGSTDRAMGLFVSLFVIVSMLSPVQELLGNNFRQSAFGTQHTQETVQQAVLDSAAEAIRRSAQTVLDKYGIEARVEVQTVVRDGEVHAGRFVIYGAAGEKAQEITDEIYALTGELPILENIP